MLGGGAAAADEEEQSGSVGEVGGDVVAVVVDGCSNRLDRRHVAVDVGGDDTSVIVLVTEPRDGRSTSAAAVTGRQGHANDEHITADQGTTASSLLLIPPHLFLRPFSGTTWVRRCHKRISGLYAARED